MAIRTPPPPNRALTPPTPLHGPMFDSPRRSSRIHNKQKHSPANLMDSPPLSASTRKRSGAGPAASQALSPPSSPISPDQRAQLSKRKLVRTQQQQSESSITAPPVNAGRPLHEHLTKMYPTPMKTPRKRAPRADLGSTARVLFHDRETDPAQIMPTPSKSKTKRHTAFSLESFEEEQQNGSKVQIYTDSKERMPDIGEDDDNPFVVNRSAKMAQSEPAPGSSTRSRAKAKHGMSKTVDQAVENDKGAVYTFRGKKLYRKFEEDSNGEPISDDGDPASAFSDQDLLRHQAGDAPRKRFTRSSIKPRLLFPPKKANGSMQEVDDDPEEATTDIETPAEDVNTGSQRSFGVGTPPADEKQKRSPFDSWPRTKPGRGGRTKRPGSPMEKKGGERQKRSRSAQLS